MPKHMIHWEFHVSPLHLSLVRGRLPVPQPSDVFDLRLTGCPTSHEFCTSGPYHRCGSVPSATHCLAKHSVSPAEIGGRSKNVPAKLLLIWLPVSYHSFLRIHETVGTASCGISGPVWRLSGGLGVSSYHAVRSSGAAPGAHPGLSRDRCSSTGF